MGAELSVEEPSVPPSQTPHQDREAFHRHLGELLLATTTAEHPARREALRETLRVDLLAAEAGGLCSPQEGRSIWSLWHYVCGGLGDADEDARKRRAAAVETDLQIYVQGQKRRRCH